MFEVAKTNMAGWKLATLLNGQSSHHRFDTVVHTLFCEIILPAKNKDKYLRFLFQPLIDLRILIIMDDF